MKWFKKRKAASEPSPPDEFELSFRERVEAFWGWWGENTDRIYGSIEGDGGESVETEVSQQVNRLCSGLGWVFGPGPDGVGHSFTLSPEADAHKRFLVRHWFSKAPEFKGWVFYPARQPSYDFGKSTIRLRDTGAKVCADSLWITPKVDIEQEEIDIVVWSPAFEEIERDQAMRILFLYLDEALGEEGTECCIGAIDIGDDKLDRSFPLTELPEFVDSVFDENEWNRDVMGWCTFEVDEISGDFPRSDIYVGTSRHMKLVNEYIGERGPIENPIEGSGAEYVFLQLPAAIFPKGKEVDVRCDISDAIKTKFDEGDSGVVLGGAMGSHAAYIDFLLFDPERARRAISEVLADRDLSDLVQVFAFAK